MMGDDRLVEAVATGDGGALRELYDRHASWVAARLRRAMPAHAVENTLQETFIAVWRGAKGTLGYYPNITVFEFVECFALLREMPPAEVRPAVARTIERVGLGERAKSKMKTLSGE